MSAGTSALASSVAAKARSSNAGTSASSSLRCSARMPERPAAPPRRASRKAAATAAGPSWMRRADRCSTTACGMGVRGSGGRRAGSVNACKASLPGASSAAVRTWRALESSPALTFAQACSRLRSARVSASRLCAPDFCGDGSRPASPHPIAEPSHLVGMLLRAPAIPRAPGPLAVLYVQGACAGQGGTTSTRARLEHCPEWLACWRSRVCGSAR